MSPALLPALWARALVGLARDHEADGAGPSLPLWSNLLRIVDAGGIALRDAPRLARFHSGPLGQAPTQQTKRDLASPRQRPSSTAHMHHSSH